MKEFYRNFCEEVVNEEGTLIKFNLKFKENFNFGFDVVDCLAEQFPNEIALVWCDENLNERRFTFKEISYLSNQVVNFLMLHNVNRFDFVLLILKRHYSFWVILVALHKIGAVAIPATHMLTEEDLTYRVEFAKIKHIIFLNTPEITSKILNVKNGCLIEQKLFSVDGSVSGCVNLTDGIKNQSAKLNRVETNFKDTMLAYFTSGTNGMPKLVEHSFSYPLGHIVTAKYWQNVQFRELHLTVSETGWGKAVWGKIYGQWIMGAPVLAYEYGKFSADGLLNIIEKFKVKTFCAPPTIYRYFMKHGLKGYNLSSLKYVTTAGEALDKEIIKQFKEKTGLQIMEGFGQTETVAILISYAGEKTKIGSIGKTSPMFNLVVVNENDEEVGVNEEGELCVRIEKNQHQVGLFKEYYGDLKLTEFTKRNLLHHTGDVVRKDEDGFFWYVGRKDDIIKTSGYRVSPFEIESVLIKHSAVLECGVVGVEDEIRGQSIKASVVLTEGFRPSRDLEIELQEFVKQKTAPYKYPRTIEFVEELPKTISGKVKRRLLKQSL